MGFYCNSFTFIGGNMIERCEGSIFDSDAIALVNPVNCIGVMGKGLALEFKKRYPDNFTMYQLACSEDRVVIGKMLTYLNDGKYIINFPTKKHWKSPSKIEYIEAGLEDLNRVMQLSECPSVAIPKLGCGLGGLDWAQVYALIEAEFAELPDLKVLVYG